MLSPEVSVIGSILIDARCLSQVRETVTTEMFETDPCRAVFTAACQLADDGKPVDPITIKGLAPELTNDFLYQVMEITPTAANAGAYAEEVRKGWLRRRMAESLYTAYGNLLNGQDPLTIGSEVVQELEGITTGEAQQGVISAGDAAASLVQRWEQADAGNAFTIPTGYSKLDKILGGGLIRSGLYILAARPGCGKTTLAQNITERMLKKGRRVLFVSLEMEVWELEARRLAIKDGRHTATEILRRDFPDGDYNELVPALLDLSKAGLTYCTKTGVRVSDIVFLARHSKADVVMIDYLGLLTYEPGRSIYERVTATSNALKRAARSLKTPILCLAQLNREVEGRRDAAPRLSDLRDSGAIEQDADGVLLLHKPPVESTDSRLVSLDVTVAKNRHGATGKVPLSWAMRNGRIVPEGW